MRTPLLLTALLLAVTFSGCVDDGTADTDSTSGPEAWRDQNQDGNVVVAVIDSGFNPYHFDMLADHMPQYLNNDSSDDVPLHADPAQWLPGHPGAEAFASYSRLDLTLTPDDPDADPDCDPNGGSGGAIQIPPGTNNVGQDCGHEDGGLYQQDADEWDKIRSSSLSDVDDIHMSYIPGTKVVGYVNFGGGTGFAASSHGVGTSSVSVGNIHGSCPHCLLVFVNGLGEQANRWVESQDWIDAQTNSWGYSAGLLVRDRFYAGSDVQAQRDAVERGQAIFFSAGNGLGNTFTAPNPTLFSSQEGPDWIITVGAISPDDGSSYTGHGKPADVASLGSGYASAGGGNVSAEGSFGGTSNATPVTAGMYAEALWRIRNMDGTRVQRDHTISTGGSCGDANADCALADGNLTYSELRDALYAAAQPVAVGHNPSGFGPVPQSSGAEELNHMAEGHGSFFAKLDSEDAWDQEVQRIVDIATGAVPAPETDADTAAWSNAMSYCTQAIWGGWEHGHADEATLPDADPEWPVRAWFVERCPTEGPAIIAANGVVTDVHPFY